MNKNNIKIIINTIKQYLFPFIKIHWSFKNDINFTLVYIHSALRLLKKKKGQFYFKLINIG